MMKRILIISLLLLSVCPLLHSQEEASSISILNRAVPPSPGAAALARYGEYPVGHTTGVPKIEIPLYDIQLGDYHLPISISYHASGIRVDDVASTVGLGWVLNAGGVVTRTIHGAPDLRLSQATDRDTLYHSYAELHTLIEQMKSSGGLNFDRLLTIINQGAIAEETFNTNSKYDVQSDRYCYKFGNKSGVLRYSHKDNSFVTLNADPLYIYVTRGENSEFYILDTDGIVYIFQDKEYVGPTNEETLTEISSWYLSEIQTPNGNITFEYDKKCYYHYAYALSESMDLGYYRKLKIMGKKSDPLWIPEDGIGLEGLDINDLILSLVTSYSVKTNKESIQHLYNIPILKCIRWNGNRIDFSYSTERRDHLPIRLTKMEVRDFQGEIVKTISFDNDYYLGRDLDNYRMLLRGLSVSTEGLYSFVYDTSRQLPSYYLKEKGLDGNVARHRSRTDYWGYWNGTESQNYVSVDVIRPIIDSFVDNGHHFSSKEHWLENTANKNPNFEYAKTGVLKSITFPTGGSTGFVYEPNVINGDTVGGLRIKRISSFANDGKSRIKNYYYDWGYVTHDPPEYMMRYKVYHRYLTISDSNILCERTRCLAEPILPLSDNSGSPVFYETIREVDNEGTICYEYLPGDSVKYIGTLDNPLLSPSNLNDEGYARPYLESKKIYDKTGLLLQTESYEYESKGVKSYEVGNEVMCIYTIGTEFGEILPLSSCDVDSTFVPHAQVLAHSSVCLLKSRTVTDNVTGVSRVESFTYDSLYRNLKPKSVTRTGSDGKVYRTDYEYTIDRTDNLCDSMANMYGMLDQVVGERYYCNDNLLSTKAIDYVYNGETDWFYPKYIRSALQGNPLEEDIHFARYDDKGNILTLVENATDTVALVWGYHSQYPVAQIKGASHERLRTAWGLESLLTSIESCDDSSEMGNHLANLRTALANKNVLLTTYVYRPMFGPTAITNENGYTLYYDYHDDGKLSVIRDAQGVIKTFDYNYKNPHEE